VQMATSRLPTGTFDTAPTDLSDYIQAFLRA
jgi:hypothetical protein